MSDTERHHPDLFNASQAVAYLHLESEASLRTLREDFGLVGYQGVGKGFMYWREDLDNVALRIVGRAPLSSKQAPKLRMAR